MYNEFITGKSFLITGSFENFSRDEIKDYILRYGGSNLSSVCKNSDYLIKWEKVGSKLDKSIALGIKIIDENDLMSIMSKDE